MNLDYFYKQQRKLDAHIAESKGVYHKSRRTFEQKVLAFKQEFGELLQRLPEVFKYWSNKKNIIDNETLEEWVDGFHFLLSIGLTKNWDIEGVVFIDSDISLLSIANKIYKEFPETKIEYIFLFNRYYTFIRLLGYTDEQIKAAYDKKCQINHERQTNGY